METKYVILIIVAIVIIVVVITVVSSFPTNVPCYTVSAGKDWSGTYYLNNNKSKKFGRDTFELKSGAYALVWDTPTSYWTFLSTAQQQSLITSGLISMSSGARTAIVSDNNGYPASSTAINDWLTSDARGTFSPNCVLAKSNAAFT